MEPERYPCACCGYLTLGTSPGHYEICPICFWEDDPVQLLDPWCEGGANAVSLVQAQRSYASRGVSEARFKGNVRSVLPTDVRDATWRPVAEGDRERATTPERLNEEKPSGPWRWHYWK